MDTTLRNVRAAIRSLEKKRDRIISQIAGADGMVEIDVLGLLHKCEEDLKVLLKLATSNSIPRE